MPVILYGCATFFVALREEYRRIVSENRMLSGTVGPNRVEIRGGLTELLKLSKEQANE
jgi:hypothetical protein